MSEQEKKLLDEFAEMEEEKGISSKTQKEKGYQIHEVEILQSRNLFGREKGIYTTITFDRDYEGQSIVLSQYMRGLLKKKGYRPSSRVLLVGLGNQSFVCDSLGPQVIVNLSREVLKKQVKCFAPNVYGVTGLETQEMIHSIVKSFHIQYIILVDSLVTSKEERLFYAYQLSNTGIQPGSGLHKKRKAITEKTMGIPVFTLGVATVIDIQKDDLYTKKEVDSEVERMSLIIAETFHLLFAKTPQGKEKI